MNYIYSDCNHKAMLNWNAWMKECGQVVKQLNDNCKFTCFVVFGEIKICGELDLDLHFLRWSNPIEGNDVTYNWFTWLQLTVNCLEKITCLEEVWAMAVFNVKRGHAHIRNIQSSTLLYKWGICMGPLKIERKGKSSCVSQWRVYDVVHKLFL